MASHEFGIMEHDPVHGERYDDYEPQKYNCIYVNDDHIEPILDDLSSIDFFSHSADISITGIEYAGITLIPPESAERMIHIIENIPELYELKALLSEAKQRNKFVIHFGM